MIPPDPSPPARPDKCPSCGSQHSSKWHDIGCPEVAAPAPEAGRELGSAEQFHKSRGDLIIPLYAKLDENGQGRQPTKDEILAAIYKFAEAYAESRLSTVVEGLRNMTDCPSAPTFCNCPAHEKRHAILRDFPPEPKP